MCDFRIIQEIKLTDGTLESYPNGVPGVASQYEFTPEHAEGLYMVGISGVGYYYYKDGTLIEEGSGWEATKWK